MKYVHLLEKLRPHGVGQVGSLTRDGYELVIIARFNEAIFPFQFANYPMMLENGDDSDIDEEVILAVARRFGIDSKALFP